MPHNLFRTKVLLLIGPEFSDNSIDMNKNSPLSKLLQTLPQQGRVEWIGLRPQRDASLELVNSVSASTDKGLIGDRFNGRPGSPRQVTLIQQEHLAVIASCLNLTELDPSVLRRNIVVSGVNLLALKDKTFCIGSAVLETTGLCHPCSKMEAALGPGGYNAVRGHGGITARILKSGEISIGDTLEYPGNRA